MFIGVGLESNYGFVGIPLESSSSGKVSCHKEMVVVPILLHVASG
jgi:hypothetical protein